MVVAKHYLHTDHLDTPRVATDGTGTAVWRRAGEGFGSTTPLEDPDGDGIPTRVNLSVPGSVLRWRDGTTL